VSVDIDWQAQSICRGYDPETFWPLSDSAEAAEPAKAICGRCPVEARCLAWAVGTGEEFGIFGGRTARERRKYGTGPLPEPKPEPQPEPKPSKVRTVIPACSKPGHEPSDMRKRAGRRNTYYCQACSADRVRASRARQTAGVPS
jgi:WhiB family transcriptional regulator, redox-sensing transcriptional regulator